MTYSEKLLSPKWQRKRQDILTRDNYTCVLCSDTETTLHVHHKKYINGREPWEYEDDNFQTLCKHCHAVVEDIKGLSLKPVVSAKRYISDFNTFAINTICIDSKGKFLVIHQFDETKNSCSHICNISKKTIETIITLFQYSEKLTTHAEGSSIPILPE